MTSATHKEKIPKRRYEVLIKDNKKVTLISHVTKVELNEYIDYLEKVCPKCFTSVNIDRMKGDKYFCEVCKKEYVLNEEYQFMKWEQWMESNDIAKEIKDAGGNDYLVGGYVADKPPPSQ